MCSSPAVYTPYDGGEVRSNLGLDESFVEGSVWSGDHQRGEQAEGEVLKGVGDAAQTPEETRHQLVTKNKEKNAAVLRASVKGSEATWSYSPSRKLTHSVFCLDWSGARASGLQVT